MSDQEDKLIVHSSDDVLRIEAEKKRNGTARIAAYYKNSLIPDSTMDNLPVQQHSIRGVAAYFVVMKGFLIQFLKDQDESDHQRIIQETIADIKPV